MPVASSNGTRLYKEQWQLYGTAVRAEIYRLFEASEFGSPFRCDDFPRLHSQMRAVGERRTAAILRLCACVGQQS